MKVDQVIRLLEAGYSKEEIQHMEQGAQETNDQKPSAEQKEPEKKPSAEQKEPEKKPAEASEEKSSEPEEKNGPAAGTAPDPETGKRLDGIEQQLKQLIKSIQANNVRRDSYGNSGEDIDTQAEKAMAALISHEGKE